MGARRKRKIRRRQDQIDSRIFNGKDKNKERDRRQKRACGRKHAPELERGRTCAAEGDDGGRGPLAGLRKPHRDEIRR